MTRVLEEDVFGDTGPITEQDARRWIGAARREERARIRRELLDKLAAFRAAPSPGGGFIAAEGWRAGLDAAVAAVNAVVAAKETGLPIDVAAEERRRIRGELVAFAENAWTETINPRGDRRLSLDAERFMTALDRIAPEEEG